MLGASDAPPARVINAHAQRPLLLVCEHASPRLPTSFQGRYPDALMRTHYGSDIGTEMLVEQLAGLLDARAVLANYSRILIDCNRRLDDPTLILADADGEAVAANTGLAEAIVRERVESIYAPFHVAVEAELRALSGAGQLPVYVAIHSFTPLLAGATRPWDAGLMWDVDDRLASRMLQALGREAGLKVGANEPYSGKHVADFSVDYHAERNGLANLAIEIRQDHLSSPAGIQQWAERLAGALDQVLGSADLHRLGDSSTSVPEFVEEAAVFSLAARNWSQENAR